MFALNIIVFPTDKVKENKLNFLMLMRFFYERLKTYFIILQTV